MGSVADTTTARIRALASGLAARIRAEAGSDREYVLMEFCGGHTHAIFRHGLLDLLPENVRMVHGPGCPVCVLPRDRIDHAVTLALREGVTLCSYGDMMRVPGARNRSLQQARAEGADVRMVYSPMQALDMARRLGDRQVVFFAIGFETTAPPTAAVIRRARAEGLRNFTVFCNHVLTPPAIANILESPALRQLGPVRLDGFLGPGHVSAVIGSQPYEYFAEEYRRPVVIAGFEPTDVLAAILMLIRQINAGRHEVEVQYRRAVSREGNPHAKGLVAGVFEMRKIFRWRGLGAIPYSALRIRDAFADFDAERRFPVTVCDLPEPPDCLCGAIIRGMARPTDCPLFGRACTPLNPIGSCMVSGEGACAAYHMYQPG
jgi:hydrogenase expression/formation protein HypD